MFSKFRIANLFLVAVVVLLGFKNYQVWTNRVPAGAVRGNEMDKRPEEISETPPMLIENHGEKKSPIPFKVIAEKNIFSSERKEFPVAPPPIVVNQIAKPIVRPQVILNGVAIAEDYEGATVTHPGRPLRKGERESITLKIGERVGEYRLAKVLPDRIRLENGNDSFEVFLYDPKKPKMRDNTRPEARPPDDSIHRPASSPLPGVPLVPDPSAVAASPGVPSGNPQAAPAATPGSLPAPLSSEASLEKPGAPARPQLSQRPPRSGPSRINPAALPRWPSRPARPFPPQSQATPGQ